VTIPCGALIWSGKERKRWIDEAGLFDDAQTVIILAFVHGHFHNIRKMDQTIFKLIDD
jgi:hypothetical protein